MATVNLREEKEVWKSPPSLNKRWVEVSNLGRVRTKPHKSKFTNRYGRIVVRGEPGLYRNCSKDSRGRFQVAVSRDGGGSRLYLVHRLVAECFVKNPKPSQYTYVFFKNGDISDCRAVNLLWGDLHEKGYLQRGKYVKHIITIFDNGIKLGEYRGLGEAARAIGCSKQAVDIAIRRGTLCKGLILKAGENNFGEIHKNIGGMRDERRIRSCYGELPDAVFSSESIDITPKAVF